LEEGLGNNNRIEFLSPHLGIIFELPRGFPAMILSFMTLHTLLALRPSKWDWPLSLAYYSSLNSFPVQKGVPLKFFWARLGLGGEFPTIFFGGLSNPRA